MRKRDKISIYSTQSLLRNPFLGKPITYLLIFTFLVTNTSYAFEPTSTMRQVRPEEVVKYREAVEALIENYQDHQLRIDTPLDTAADEPNTPRLRYVQLSEFRHGTALGTMCNYLRHSGLENLVDALIILCKQKRLQRFRPQGSEWVVYDPAAKKQRRIDGHASDARITVRDRLDPIEDAAVLAHELLDWYNAVNLDDVERETPEFLGPILEVAVKEALTSHDIGPIRQFAQKYPDSMAGLIFKHRHNSYPELLKTASIAEADGGPTPRHYTSARTSTTDTNTDGDDGIFRIGVSESLAMASPAQYAMGEFKFGNLGMGQILSDEFTGEERPKRIYERLTGEESIKLIMDKSNRKVVGAITQSADLARFIDTAVNLGATIDDIAEMIFPHPTMSEAIGELAELLARGKSIHTRPPRGQRLTLPAKLKDNSYDIAIIGAGPAGYVAAIRAAQEGKNVVIIDKLPKRLGGTCLNEGCIPTKIAWHAIMRHSQLNTKEILGDIAGRTRPILTRLWQGIEDLLATNGVERVYNTASIEDIENIDKPGEMIKIPLGDGSFVEAEKLIFATGSRPSTIPGIDIDNESVIDSTKALELLQKGQIPENLTVVGAGAIGLEFATIFRALGCNVTVVEKENQICPGILDKDIAEAAQCKLEAKGIIFRLGESFKSTDIPKNKANKVLMAVGRTPNTEGFRELGIKVLPNGMVDTDSNTGQIKTAFSETFVTAASVNGDAFVYDTGLFDERLYAAGDINGDPLLAHKASYEGKVAAEAATINGYVPSKIEKTTIPSVVFTAPEIATVGISETAARALYAPLKIEPDINIKYFRTADGDNLIKLVTHTGADTIIGASIIGPKAPYLVAEIALAIKMGLTLYSLINNTDIGFLTPMSITSSPHNFGPGALYPPDTTPLLGENEKDNADTAEFAGKKGMAMQYQPAHDPDRTVADEVMAVHNAAGLFDITHMRVLKVEGTDAFDFLQYTTTADMHELEEVGDSQFSLITDENGTIVDDIWVYRIGEASYMLFVNASNWEKDYEHLRKHRGAPFRQNEDITIKDLGSDPHEQKVAIALQGKMSDRVLQPIADYDLVNIGRHKIVECDLIVDGKRVRALISRTGYTSEYGFEIFIHPDHVAALWRDLLEIGEEMGVMPCGLSARDVLRVEGGCWLYGKEIPHATPYEIGQGGVVALNKKNVTGQDEVNFLGKEALAVQKENQQLRLVSIVLDKNKPKERSTVYVDGRPVGHATSVVRSPLLDKPIALALVNKEHAKPGTLVTVGDGKEPGKIVRTPIYRYKQNASYLIVNRPTGGTDIDDREAMLEDIGGPGFTEIELFKLFEEKVYPSYLKACEMQGLPAKPFKKFFRDTYRMPDGLPSRKGLSWRSIVDRIFGWFKKLSGKNKDLTKCPSFLGGDIYNWCIPDIVNRIGQHRGFSTGYTAYQPEASQGNLAALYMYQSLIQELTKMDSSNASLYNGPTALAEAMLMAHRIVNPGEDRSNWKRNKVVVANSLSPACKAVLQNYALDMGLEIVQVPFDKKDTKADVAALKKVVDRIGNELVCVIAEQPNFLGAIETELKAIGTAAHSKGGLFAVHVNDPHTLASLRPPGEYGADIVTAEGQPLGTPMAMGGLGLGIMATKKEYIDEMPGRIVGKTKDIKGNEAFTLIKGSREQHKSREKATSNICTAQALIAIRATAYLLSVGWDGLFEANLHSRKLCASFTTQIEAIPGFIPLNRNVMGQVAVRVPTDAAELNEKLLDNHGIISGIDVSEYVSENGGPAKHVILFSFTNANTQEDVDRLVDAIIDTMEGVQGTREKVSAIRQDWRTNMAKNLEVDAARLEMAEIPSLSDDDLYKLFWKWANLNHDMDKGDYFLGSCTMKENDRENERAGSLPGFMNIHPLQPAKTIQPLLKLLSKFKVYLCEITGMFAATLAPLAGAHGELVALKMFRAYHRHVHKGQPRDLMITPATSHGTNPASITMAGMKALPVKVDEDGNVDIDDLERILNDPNNAGRIAGIMLTIPNTLGLFEPRTPEISAMIHAAGALVYMDGANFNAIIGQVRPVDLGVDAMHFNPHKTFGTLHGGGGPGAGPVVVSDLLVEYLPSPTIEHRAAQTTGGELAIAAGYHINHSGPGRSIGNVSGHHGAIGVLIGAARYAFTMGVKGLLEISINATVNANHAFAKIINSGLFKVEHNTEDYRMHECVVTPCDELLERGITTMDIAKRLLDKGVHPPTVYFPKNVHEAIMIEPTDTASKRDVEIFEKAIIEVAREALGDRKALRKAVKELVAAGYREELETQLEAANLLSEAHREQDETVEEALVHTVAESKKMTLEEALDSDQGRRNLGILILAGAPWSRPVRRIDDETSEDTGTSDIEGFLRAELSDEKAQTVKKVEAPPKLRNRNPDDYYFSRSHEYLRVEQAGDKTIATIGITLNAAVLLAKPIDKLPGLSDLAVGQTVAKDGVFDSLIETAKSVADLHCPVSGKIIAVHHDIEKPIIASSDPYGDRTETLEQGGWLMKIELSDPSELDDLMRLPEYLTHARKACGVKYASKFVENEGFDLPASGGGGRTATVAGMQGDLQKAMLSLAKKAKYFDTVAEDTRFVSSVEILKERGKSLLMHAEPALKNGLLLDLQYTLSHIDHNALSEIVIYAEDAGNARAITSLIDAINEKTKKEFKTVIVLKSELLAASKPVGDHVLLLRSLVEYLCAKQESSIRTKEDIFGILIGRMNDNIHEDTLAAATACYASMEKIQVVALTDMGEDAVYGYSFNDALNLLATAADEEYLLFLKPIRRLTPELQREYEEYLRSFEALASV